MSSARSLWNKINNYDVCTENHASTVCCTQCVDHEVLQIDVSVKRIAFHVSLGLGRSLNDAD